MNIFKRFNKEERGQVLILSLIFLLFGSLTIPPLLSFTFTELDTTMVYQSNTMELYTCDSAIEDGVHKLIKMASPLGDLTVGDDYTYTTEINGKTATVTLTKLSLLSGIIGDDEYAEDRPHEGWIEMGDPTSEAIRNYEEDWVEYRCQVDFNYTDTGNRKLESLGMWFSPYPGDIVTGPYDEEPVPIITFDFLESFEERITAGGWSYVYRWQIPLGPEFDKWNQTGSLSLKFRVDDAYWEMGTFFVWATIKSQDISYVSSSEMVKWQIEANVDDTTIRAEFLNDFGICELLSWELLD